MNPSFSKKVVAALNSVKATSGRNDKIRILTDFVKSFDSRQEYDLFQRICVNVFDYLVTFNIKKLPDYVLDPLNPTYSIQHHLDVILPKLSSRSITGNRARGELADAFSYSDCEETAFLLKCILKKTFDIGADVSTFNKAFGFDLVEEHKVSLCTPATEKLINDFKYPAYGQLKYDAMRIEVDVQDHSVTLVTRPGKSTKTSNPKIDDEIQRTLAIARSIYQSYGYNVKGDRLHIDGEMVFLDSNGNKLPRQASNGIGNKLLQGTKEQVNDGELVFCVWDIITPEEKRGELKIPYVVRFRILADVIYGLSVFELAETTVVNNKEDAIELAVKYIKSGLEGCIVKDMHGFWDGSRVKTQIKLKAARECEMRVVALNISTDTKYDGLVGSIECVSEDGLVTANISGMTDEERSSLLTEDGFIGSIITVRFNEIITNKKDSSKFSLFLPRMIERRFDKTKADTYHDIKEAEFVVFA